MRHALRAIPASLGTLYAPGGADVGARARPVDWVGLIARMMIYFGAPGAGSESPIIMSGAFTDQGVLGEQTRRQARRLRPLCSAVRPPIPIA